MKRLIIGLTTVACIGLLALSAHAAEGIQKKVIHFKKGSSQTTIKGQIKGRETIDYLLTARAGQTMTVNLKAGNSGAYFNVLPPGSEVAIFTGQVAGPHFEGKLPQDGEYTIRVYLVRAAARRSESARYTLTVKVAGGAPAAPAAAAAFDRKLNLQGVSFHVVSPNASSGNTLKIVPSGLKEDNRPISLPIDGVVVGAEVADLNADQSPEIYVYVRGPGPQAPMSLVAYSSNRRKSLSDIYVPPLSEHAQASAGYNGHDDMAVVEGVFVRRFPIFGKGGDALSRTGKMRQVQYKLIAGEASWALKVDKVVEY